MARDFERSTPDKIEVVGGAGMSALTSAVSISYLFRHESAPGSGYPNRFPTVNRGTLISEKVNYAIVHDGGGNFRFVYSTADSTYVEFVGAQSLDTGVWHNLVVTSNFSTGQFYYDGSPLSMSTTGTPGTPQTASLVSLLGTFANAAEHFDGALAEVGIWSSVLSAGDAVALAKGMCPRMVSLSTLEFYMPLIGRNSPEPELVAGSNGVLTGTAYADHPRVIYPKRRQVV